MILERKRMEAVGNEKSCYGHITLDKLAIPESVKVTLLGEPIIPASFDSYGHPNFTEEQEMLYRFKEYEINRFSNSNNILLAAEITYEENFFDVSREIYDSVSGIERSLQSLSDFNEVLLNRVLFHKVSSDVLLDEFILFGRYLLDHFGQIMSVKKLGKENLVFHDDVTDFYFFERDNQPKSFSLTYGNYAIPTAGSVCPCCGKMFTMDDVKNNPCVYIDDKFYHDSCWRNYRKLTEVDKFTHKLMDLLYKSTDYQFELLPNGYCHEDCCSHVPWFLFHTIDGDIIMGWRKRVISIEWQKNYKPFDMNALFGTEDVTKWDREGNRGIHAWGKEKAYEYLKKVLESVNPGYSRR